MDLFVAMDLKTTKYRLTADFAHRRFPLDMLRPLSLLEETVDGIGLRYRRDSDDGEGQVPGRPNEDGSGAYKVLVSEGCHRITKIEAEISYIEVLDTMCATQIRIMKGVQE